jgi:hypothetical protein
MTIKFPLGPRPSSEPGVCLKLRVMLIPQMKRDLWVQLVTNTFTKATYSLQLPPKMLLACGHPEIRQLEIPNLYSGAACR